MLGVVVEHILHDAEVAVHYEREIYISIFFRGYRYTLRDQDTTWPAACESARRGYEKNRLFTKFPSMVSKVRCLVWYMVWWALVHMNSYVISMGIQAD